MEEVTINDINDIIQYEKENKLDFDNLGNIIFTGKLIEEYRKLIRSEFISLIKIEEIEFWCNYKGDVTELIYIYSDFKKGLFGRWGNALSLTKCENEIETEFEIKMNWKISFKNYSGKKFKYQFLKKKMNEKKTLLENSSDYRKLNIDEIEENIKKQYKNLSENLIVEMIDNRLIKYDLSNKKLILYNLIGLFEMKNSKIKCETIKGNIYDFASKK